MTPSGSSAAAAHDRRQQLSSPHTSISDRLDDDDASYPGPPRCPVDRERLQVVCSLEASGFDAARPESKYDDVTKLLCELFDVPVGVIDVVAKSYVHSKSVAAPPAFAVPSKNDRHTTACAWMLVSAEPEVLIVEDMAADGR